ncbi:unnamed protein product (mitochondrion) [Plasmodiophora brassicae]|uniref:Thioredoxin domain-containing protein n=1 Tax=Plasmodiophora brassicae TaxID=37360 RepID=A0A0G4J8T5_PLABS|nr:hypothetical protein PBRA_003376 [Plasmodiophora brassicae]SPQ99726.1 unnamed protein product [Plasmodiophora brassicae]
MPARVLCIVAVSALLHVSVSSSSVELLSDGDFYEKIKHDVWVVAFTATWCGHCKKLAPILEDLGRDVQAGSTGIRIAKVDVTTNPTVARLEAIEYFPTIYFYCEEKSIRVQYGEETPRTKEEIMSWIMKQYARVDPSKTTNNENPPGVQRRVDRNTPRKRTKELSSDQLDAIPDIVKAYLAEAPLTVLALVYVLGLVNGIFVGVMFRVNK